MSKRITHILEVLTEIKSRYSGATNISSLRIQATQLVAAKHNVIRNTIFDTLTRQLGPDIKSAAHFEELTIAWLNDDSQDLNLVISKHCADKNDMGRVQLFFDESSHEWSIDSGILPLTVQTYKEGSLKQVVHLVKERNRGLVNAAKAYWQKQFGHVRCSVCNFNFLETYGERGFNFIEAHHNLPLAEVNQETAFEVKDLSPVCSNCHRMIHQRQPWLTIAELSELLNSRASKK